MRQKLLISAFLKIGVLLGNIGPSGFDPFLNDCFVETGTFSGDGVIKALNAGFSRIFSIESDPNNYRDCCNRLEGIFKVKLFHGDSSKDLWAIIQNIETPITFWLDAHIFPPIKGKNCPLLEELDQIQQHPIKTHTILIDDMHCCGTEAFDFLSQEDIKKKIWEINPDYEISYCPGGNQGEYPENVMVARISKPQ